MRRSPAATARAAGAAAAAVVCGDGRVPLVARILEELWGWGSDEITIEDAEDGVLVAGSAAHWIRVAIKPGATVARGAVLCSEWRDWREALTENAVRALGYRTRNATLEQQVGAVWLGLPEIDDTLGSDAWRVLCADVKRVLTVRVEEATPSHPRQVRVRVSAHSAGEIALDLMEKEEANGSPRPVAAAYIERGPFVLDEDVPSSVRSWWFARVERSCHCGDSECCSLLISAAIGATQTYLAQVDAHGTKRAHVLDGIYAQIRIIPGTDHLLFFDADWNLTCVPMSHIAREEAHRILVRAPSRASLPALPSDCGRQALGFTLDEADGRVAIIDREAGRFRALQLPADLLPPPRCEPCCACRAGAPPAGAAGQRASG